MYKYRFYGNVKNGKLEMIDRDKFAKCLSSLKGSVEISIGAVTKLRSENENKYYWAVVVKMIANEMGTLPDYAHDMLKQMFLKNGYSFKGKQYDYVRSTTSLSTKEFEDYLEKIRMWSASELECIIPLPNEVDLD